MSGVLLGAALAGDDDLFSLSGESRGVSWFCVAFDSAFRIAMCLVLEADRQWDLLAKIQAERLLRGFSGRCIDAGSSVLQDKESILQEIKGCASIEEVDEAIDVLIRTGMSTPNLRETAKAGIDVDHFARYQCFWVVMILGAVLQVLVDLFFRCDVSPILGVLLMIGTLSWCIAWIIISPDRRAFASMAVGWFVAVPLAICMVFVDPIVSTCVGEKVGIGMCAASTSTSSFASVFLFVEVLVVTVVFIPLATALSFAGSGRVVRIPCVGIYIARLVAGGTNWRCCHRMRQPWASSELALVQRACAP